MKTKRRLSLKVKPSGKDKWKKVKINFMANALVDQMKKNVKDMRLKVGEFKKNKNIIDSEDLATCEDA